MNKLKMLLISLLFLNAPAYAATTANSIITAQTPSRGIVQFLQGTDAAGTYKTLYTAGTNGSMISGLSMTNNDAAATHLVTCQVVNGGVRYGGTSLTTVLNAGFATAVTAPPQSLMSPVIWPGLPLDGNGDPYIYLTSGDTLQCTFATALTASDLINIIAIAEDF